MYKLVSERKIKTTWIWRAAIHPRIKLFLWKVAWGRLSTRSLLRDRGMELSIIYPSCGMEDETMEYALLRCPRVCLNWRMAGGPYRGVSSGSCLSSFFGVICHGSTRRLAYIAYQIWLSRNSLIFDAEIVPAHRVLEKAYYLVKEYYRFDAVGQFLDDLSSWGFLTTPAVVCRMLFISWEPPPSGFVKINFNDSIRGVEMIRTMCPGP
ncbi:uncharacterized protein [Elaeis guineensis]|uniref:uncharacterized protein n=1 Tax=Elaeis guineensis var. tenera TaxID=51953 RepID=UPI003C6DB0A2